MTSNPRSRSVSSSDTSDPLSLSSLQQRAAETVEDYIQSESQVLRPYVTPIVERIRQALMAFEPNEQGPEAAAQAQRGIYSANVDGIGRIKGRAYQAFANVVAARLSTDEVTATAVLSALPEPITVLEQARKTVKELLRRADGSTMTSESTRESEQADYEIREQIVHVVATTDRHFRNKDAAIYAIGILHMVIRSFAEHHTRACPTFSAHKETITLSFEELKKYPEDVLGEWTEEMKKTIAMLEDSARDPDEFQDNIGQGLMRLVQLAESRKRGLV